MALISIIVPVYNIDEKYLRKCIGSLIDQTFTDIEIVLVNDGSTNNSGEICDEYANIDYRIKLLHQDNKGVSAARNNGMKFASGDWITFVDADDWIELDFCEKLKNVILKYEDIDFLMFALKVNHLDKEFENPFWNEEFTFLNKESKEELQIQLLYKTISKFSPPHNMVGVAVCKLYKAKFLKENNLTFKENLPLSEDGVFAFHALEKSEKVIYINEFLYHYRKHSESATFKYRKDAVLDYTKGMKELENCLSIYNKGYQFYKALYFRAILNISAICNQLYCHKYNQESFIEKIKGIRNLCKTHPYNTAIKKIGVRYYFEKSTHFQKLKFLLLKSKAYTLYYYYTVLVNKYKAMKMAK